MGRVVLYLARLDTARTVLWCYLLWYFVVVARHFDPSPELWGASIGLSLIIGLALLLNAGWPAAGARLGGWQKARFFMMPFCVSSFSALVKGRGFVLVFSRDLGDLAAGALACGLFLTARQLMRGRHPPA